MVMGSFIYDGEAVGFGDSEFYSKIWQVHNFFCNEDSRVIFCENIVHEKILLASFFV